MTDGGSVTWDDIEEDEELSRFYNRKKVSGSGGYESSIDYLVSEGYLRSRCSTPWRTMATGSRRG